MKRKRACILCMMMSIISFIGFCVENIWMLLSRGYMNNRNMLFPFLFGYGLAVIVMHLMFGTPQEPRLFGLHLTTEHPLINMLIFYGLVAVCISLGELLLGYFVELTTGILWWDYTRIPLHITRYTSIPTSLGFGLLVTLFMRFVFYPFGRLIGRMNDRLLAVLACILMAIMVADFIHSGIYMYRTGQTMLVWRWEPDVGHRSPPLLP